MSVVAVVVTALLLLAGALTVLRLLLGPTSLDRVVATDRSEERRVGKECLL